MPNIKNSKELIFNPDSIFNASRKITKTTLKNISDDPTIPNILDMMPSSADIDKVKGDYEEFLQLCSIASYNVNTLSNLIEYFQDKYMEQLNGAGIKKRRGGGLHLKSAEPVGRYYSKLSDFPYMTTNFLYGGANGDSDSDEEYDSDIDLGDFSSSSSSRTPSSSSSSRSSASSVYGRDDPLDYNPSSYGDSIDPADLYNPADKSYSGKNIAQSLNACMISMNKALMFFNRNIRNKINLLDRLSVQNLIGVVAELHAVFDTVNLNYFTEENAGEGKAFKSTMLNLVLVFEKLDNAVDNAVKSYAEPRRTGAGRKSSSMSGGILILNSIPDSQRRCPTKYLL
jgi:hypothetical protein